MNARTAEQAPKQPLRPGFFEEAFRDSALTPALRTFAEAFCMRFEVRGICDPLYCANVAAFETGLGDGCGNFSPIEHLRKRVLAKWAIGCYLLIQPAFPTPPPAQRKKPSRQCCAIP